MDAESIKIVFAIFYLTLLIVIACIWFRATQAPYGETYRRARRQGGYEPLYPTDNEEPAPQE